MKKKFIYTSLIIVGIAFIGFGYYAISPLFRNIKVDEKIPQAVTVVSETSIEEEASSENISNEVESKPASVVGTAGHPASGSARIITVGDKSYLRYENYKTINGPDIYVYLAKGLDAKEFISLGKVRATEGNINYEIPEGINPLDYPYVLTWCKMFGVLFNSAKLF